MPRKIINLLAFAASTLLISACSAFFDKDNTPAPAPLTDFRPEVKPHLIWSATTGAKINEEFLRLTPAMDTTHLYVAGTNGVVSAINRNNGSVAWRTDTGTPVTTAVGAGDNIVVVGSRQGDTTAMLKADGRMLWKAKIKGEILAKPAVGNGIVVVKTVDGFVRGLSAQDGHEVWAFQQVEPSLILRGASAPLIRDRNAIVGFANGNLTKLNVSDGQLQWMEPIAVAEGAFAIQRMIDIDADPIVYDHHIYAATYQGKIASLDWMSGRKIWSQDISSYTGMIADSNNVYITDAHSALWSFNADSGSVNWKQNKLAERGISAPTYMGNYLVVGDAQGYLHWLDKRDGHFAARENIGSPIFAQPVTDGNVVYVLTNKGRLYAYNLTR